jgi:hypothetical protein
LKNETTRGSATNYKNVDSSPSLHYTGIVAVYTRRDLGISGSGVNMTCDPIVEEMHQARQKLLEECNGDLDRLLDRFSTAEAEHGDRVVTLEAVRAKRLAEQERFSSKP